MTLVGLKAPLFKAQAVVNQKICNEFSLADFLHQYVIFFFYPLNFTFVCPTELHAFQEHLSAFEQRGAQIVGCSVDSCFSHLAWLSMPKAQGGIQGVSYPLVSDLNHSIAQKFDVLKEGDAIAYRALFLIDKQGIVRHQVVNDLSLGRSVDEALRMVDALIFHEQHGEVCPANWKAGQKALRPTDEGLISYFSEKSPQRL